MTRIALTIGLLVLLPSMAETEQEKHLPKFAHVTVTGEAMITTEPDQAELEMGVITQAPTAAEAAKENAERLTRVLVEVKKLLAKTDKVKTSRYAVIPNYRYPQGGKPEIVGYTVSNVVMVETATLDLVGRLIDAAMQAGANNVNRLVFTLMDKQAAQIATLRAASAKARAKAEAVASSLGLKIVRIASVVESERSFKPFYRHAIASRGESLAAQAPTPVEPGTVEVRSTVSLTIQVSENR
jgi:uncharacterized protein YggE